VIAPTLTLYLYFITLTKPYNFAFCAIKLIKNWSGLVQWHHQQLYVWR